MSDLHEAAFQAIVWQAIEKRAGELKDAAKADLSALNLGDAVAGSYRGRLVGKATMSSGRSRVTVTNGWAYLQWVKQAHPSEIWEQVNPAYLQSLRVVDGHVIDSRGEIVAGVEVIRGEPYVSVRRNPDAMAVIQELLREGLVELDGIREIEAAE